MRKGIESLIKSGLPDILSRCVKFISTDMDKSSRKQADTLEEAYQSLTSIYIKELDIMTDVIEVILI